MVGPRVLAVVLALVWGVLFFGVIDLLVVPIQDERFDRQYLLETGWGLLFTLLVMLPLVLWALFPRREVLAQQVLVTAAAVLVCGAAALSLGHVVVGLLLALTVLVPTACAGRPVSPLRGLSVTGSSRLLGGLVAVAVVVATAYAVQMVQASYDGAVDDDTWGLMHLPMQAAFGFALAGAATVAVLARGASAAGWRLAVLAPAASAVWMGAVSVAYPGHLGSLGTIGGVAAIAWGTAFAAAALLVRQPDAG